MTTLAIDIGGTKLAAALIGADGQKFGTAKHVRNCLQEDCSETGWI